MTNNNQSHSILVSALNANFSAHSYTQVVAVAATTAVINGLSIIMPAGLTLDINVRSIGANANIWLLGEEINVVMGTPIIGGTYNLGG